MMKFYVLPILLFLVAGSVSANLFRLSVDNYGNLLGADVEASATLKAAVDEMVTELENDINKDLPDADATSYLEGMANASVYSDKGLGVDYGSDMDLFMVGLGFGVGVDVGDNSFSDLTGGDVDAEEFRGFGVAAGVMGGLNLGFMPFDKFLGLKFNRLNLFFHMFTMNRDSSDFTLDFKTLGVHLQYQLISGKSLVPFKMFRWDGIKATVGYAYTGLEAVYSKTYADTKSITATAIGTKTAYYSGTATVGADVTTHSIPLEVSSGIQWAYFFTTYLGFGADINFGSAKAIANSQVDTYIDLNDSAVEDANDVQLTGVLDLGQESGPSSLTGRMFIGQQFNFSIVKLGVHLNKGLGNDLYGVNLSLKVLW